MLSKNAYSTDNPPFVDIHTHRRYTASDVVSVPNFSQKDLKNGFSRRRIGMSKASYTEGSLLASVGLHPWFLTRENFENDVEKLSQLAHNQQVIAIGECGLDRLRGEDLAFQTMAFDAQIRLAESVSKPVVVHCVRAFEEVIAVKKRLKPTVPMVIHGFNKKEEVLVELLRHGFFISIGASILQKKGIYNEEPVPPSRESPFSKMFQKIPLDRLFFETDDAENIAISDIYQTAANILKMDINDLKSIVYENFSAVFRSDLTVFQKLPNL